MNIGCIFDMSRNTQEIIDIITLQNRIETLQNKVLEIEKSNEELRIQLDEQRQKRRNRHLIIHGIQESHEENLAAKLQDFFIRTLGVTCDVIKCFRLIQKDQCYCSVQTRPVFVKFKSHRDQKSVYYAKNKLKGSDIKIMENLTSRRLELMKMAKKTFGWNNVWTRNGDIYVHFRDTCIIKSEKDIEYIKEKPKPID